MVILRLAVVVLAGALTAMSLLPQNAVMSPEVIFVCEHGAAKSVIAAAHFNKIARERGLKIQAVARGTNPDPDVAPMVVAGLRSEGVTEITQKPSWSPNQIRPMRSGWSPSDASSHTKPKPPIGTISLRRAWTTRLPAARFGNV